MKKYLDLNDYELLYLVSENNDDASNIIYDKYSPLIRKMALKFYSRGKKFGLEIEDFIQEGFYGLYLAISNFTESKDCLFYTYVITTIRNKMNNLLSKYNAYKNQSMVNCISLNETFGAEEESELMDFIEDKNEVLPEKEIDNRLFYDHLKKILYSLPIKDSMILELKMNGFKTRDISILLDIKVNEVNYTCSRLKKKIISLKKYF